MKTPLSNIVNQKGFGLAPLLLVTFGVGLAVAGMYASALTVMRSQISVSVSQDADLFVEQMSQVLTKDIVCTTALAGNVIGPTAIPISATLRLSDNDVVVAPGQQVGPGLAIQRFELEHKRAADNVTLLPDLLLVPNPDTAPNVTLRRRLGKITLQMKKSGEGLFSPLSRPREFTIHAIVNAGGDIAGCTAESTETLACTAAGGVWNALAVPPARKCEPYLHCEYAGGFSPPLGGANPAPFGNQANGNQYACPAGFTIQQTGTVTKVVSCGKYRPCNQFYPVYTCVRCGKSLSTFTASTGFEDPSFAADAAAGEQNYQDMLDRANWIMYQRSLGP